MHEKQLIHKVLGIQAYIDTRKARVAREREEEEATRVRQAEAEAAAEAAAEEKAREDAAMAAMLLPLPDFAQAFNRALVNISFNFFYYTCRCLPCHGTACHPPPPVLSN